MWEMIPKELDETDMKIIHALRKNGRISMTELGKEVFMTSQAVKNRIARLQDLGVVERYTVNVNCPLFGYTIHCVFELVTDEKTREGFLEFMKHTEYHIFHCYRASFLMRTSTAKNPERTSSVKFPHSAALRHIRSWKKSRAFTP